MPDVQILPGKPTPLPALAVTGGTVYLRNKDAANSAWVGDSGVSVGYGDEIPPLGSISWTGQGNPYAIVDDGVTTPITLSASTTNVDTNDPLALAVATALQLLESGIPIVQAFTEIASETLVPPNFAFDTGVVDVGQYASLIISILCNPPGTPGEIAPCTVTWYEDAAGTSVIDTDEFTYQVTWANGPPITTMRIPTRARYCRVYCHLNPLTRSTYAITVDVSTIPTPTSLIRSRGATDNNVGPYSAPPLLWTSNGKSVAAGGSLIGYIPPVAQSVRMTLEPSAAPAGDIVGRLYGVPQDVNGSPGLTLLGSMASLNPGGQNLPGSAIQVNAPFGMPLIAYLYNNDAVARTPSLTVYDTSDQ